MVYVHLIEKDIPASAVDVWYMLGIKFADENTMKLWSTKYNKCVPITNEIDIPKHFLPTHVTMHYNKNDIRQSTPSSILGRIVNNPFRNVNANSSTVVESDDQVDVDDGDDGGGLVEQIQRMSSKGGGIVSSDMKQIITFYSPSRKELTYVCSYPLPIVDFYECTIIVTENNNPKKKKEEVVSKTEQKQDNNSNNNTNSSNSSSSSSDKNNTNGNIKKKKKIIKKRSKTTSTNSSQNVPQRSPIPIKIPTQPSSSSSSSPPPSCTVEMECEFYVLPGFCWLAQLLGLSSKIRTDPRGPAGDLMDIKSYFQTKNEENETWNINC